MKQPLNKTIGWRIRTIRKQIGLTQALLAERINKSTEMISHLETGAASTKISTLESIAHILNVKPYTLLMDNDEIDIHTLDSLQTNILHIFNQMNPRMKNLALDILKDLVKYSDEMAK